jgi:hypothetical protein
MASAEDKPMTEGGTDNAKQAATMKPSAVATERAEKLKADLKTFTLSLNYSGPQNKPFYQLLLSVPQPPGRDNPFDQQVQVTEKQAQGIIDYLAIEGFLDHAQEGPFKRTPIPPYYALTVQVEGKGHPALYGEFLGWDLKMLERLEGLRKVLESDAAKAMDLLIGRMAGFKAGWEKQEAEGKAAEPPAPGDADKPRP